MIKGEFWVDRNKNWYARIYHDVPNGCSYTQAGNSLPEVLALLAVNRTHLDKITIEYLSSTWGIQDISEAVKSSD